MDIYTAYGILDKSLLQVIKALNVLEPVKEAIVVDSIRVEESPLILTKSAVTSSKVVTAHNLHQYKNDFHKLTLEDDVIVVLDDLLAIDKQVEVLC